MRQKDVIGEWAPVPEGSRSAPDAFVLNGREWGRGLTWEDISADLIIRKATTKTGAFAAHDLKLCRWYSTFWSEYRSRIDTGR